VLEALGFKALATTSGGFAFTLGKLDGEVTLDEIAEHTGALAEASDLPVAVDLENGYGPASEDAARAITRAAEAGAVGGSIEDWDRDEGYLYELSQAVERVAAAAEAARALDFPFTLTARAENHLRGNPEIPFAKSLPDYIMRWLASRYLDADYQEELGILTPEVRARKEAQQTLFVNEGPAPAEAEPAEEDKPANGNGAAKAPTSALTDTPPVRPARMSGLELGPACEQCGGMMQRTGSCYTCSSCGNNTGCG
jgi:Phosphoenolpyruvate phosphomutase